MKRIFLVPVILGLILSFVVAPVARAQVTVEADDPYQRRLIIWNDLPDNITIYPVIQADQNKNCSTTLGGKQLRLIVNDGAVGAGIPAGKSVTVNLPKEQPCPP